MVKELLQDLIAYIHNNAFLQEWAGLETRKRADTQNEACVLARNSWGVYGAREWGSSITLLG